MDDMLEWADRLLDMTVAFKESKEENILKKIDLCANDIGAVWSGSNIGYQACVYYKDFLPPPAGAHFSSEWGMNDPMGMGSRGEWHEYKFSDVRELIFKNAGDPDLSEADKSSKKIAALLLEAKTTALSVVSIHLASHSDAFLSSIKKQIEEAVFYSASDFAKMLIPNQARSRDSLAMQQGLRLAPHQDVLCGITALRSPVMVAEELSKLLRQAASHLFRLQKQMKKASLVGTNVFIGHGRSPVWRELKDFISERLHLPHDEFNRVPVAGVTNIARLSEMLDNAAIALIILTADDEQKDRSLHARMNVIHEAGLFQGRLGFTKAILLLEQGCEEFSNIQGLGQIRFDTGRIAGAFDEIRAVLEREGLVR